MECHGIFVVTLVREAGRLVLFSVRAEHRGIWQLYECIFLISAIDVSIRILLMTLHAILLTNGLPIARLFQWLYLGQEWIGRKPLVWNMADQLVYTEHISLAKLDPQVCTIGLSK